jgi:leucyl/phenylalanyl-tRNA---protein transferase
MDGLDATLLLRAYAVGLFPMARSAESDELFWFDPEERGILPLDGFHIPARLRRTVRSGRFAVTIDRDFAGVLDGCAEATAGRPETWINRDIKRLYHDLHRAGHAHSVEARQDGRLAGGLYGVALGGAFFGESMFSRATDASKVALVHLVARLLAAGFTLLDTQFVTGHLKRFGAVTIPRRDYRRRLANAIAIPARFAEPDEAGAVAALLERYSALAQPSTQTS